MSQNLGNHIKNKHLLFNFSFNWTCWFVTEDGKFGDKCFHDNRQDRNLVAMDTLVMSFPGSELIEADNFTFTLTVSAPNKKNQSMFQVIDLVHKDLEMAKYDCSASLLFPFWLLFNLCIISKPKF